MRYWSNNRPVQTNQPSICPAPGRYSKTVPGQCKTVPGRYWTNTGYAVLVLYWASTNKLILARYRPSIGSVLGQYCMCGIGPILGQYKQISTGLVSGLYWANTEKLFQYWAGTGPIPDMRYWSNNRPVQTNRYWPGISPVLALYQADTLKRYQANANTVCKTVPGWYWLAVLGKYRRQYWTSTIMFAGYFQISSMPIIRLYWVVCYRLYAHKRLHKRLCFMCHPSI